MQKLAILLLMCFTLSIQISSQNEVGINIANPQFTLDIRSLIDDDPAELHLSNPGNTRFLRLFSGSNTFPHPAIFWKDAHHLRFATDAGGFSEKMRILSNGRVGIGEVSPGGQLHVVANSLISFPQLRITENDNDFARIKMENTTYPSAFWDIAGKADDDENASRLNFFFSNPSTGGDRMTIMGNGRVGIGTTNPGYQLDLRKSISSTNMGDLNIGTSSNEFFLRFFGGHNADQNAKISWNSMKTLQLGSSDPDGSNYKEFLRLDGKSIGIYNTGGSVFIGEDAAFNFNSSPNPNVAIGRFAMYNNIDGSSNLAIGDLALYNLGSGGMIRNENTAIGNLSGNMTNKTGNTFIGFAAGKNNQNGEYGVYIGSRAGMNSSKSQNIMIGNEAGRDYTGSQSILIGERSGIYGSGSNNVHIGFYSGASDNTGVWNVLMGNYSGYYNESGQRNVFVGHESGFGQMGDSFSGSVMLGFRAGKNNIADDRLYIENSDSNEPLIYGEFDNNLVKVYGEFKTTNSIEVTNSPQVLKTDGKNIIEYDPVFGGIMTWGSQTDWNLFPDAIKIGGTTNFSPNSNLHITDPIEPSIILQTGEGVGNTAYWKIRRNSVGSLQWYHSTFHKMTLESAGNLGLGIENPNVRLDVAGSIEYTGSITDVSDIRLKKNIQELPSVADELEDIRAVSYEMRKEEFPEMNFEEGREYGVIAQELEPLFPELVHTDPDGYKSVDYTKLTVVLLKATQEQQQMIEEQKTMIDLLMKRINNLEQAGTSN